MKHSLIMDWKTEQEWLVINYFKENFTDMPAGRLVKGESPDFRLWINQKKFIGIELTQVHTPGPFSGSQSILTAFNATAQVKEAIRQKEGKIDRYRSEKPLQLWLIIFADYSEPHATERISKGSPHGEYGNGFERIFYFDLDGRKVWPLK